MYSPTHQDNYERFATLMKVPSNWFDMSIQSWDSLRNLFSTRKFGACHWRSTLRSWCRSWWKRSPLWFHMGGPFFISWSFDCNQLTASVTGDPRIEWVFWIAYQTLSAYATPLASRCCSQSRDCSFDWLLSGSRERSASYLVVVGIVDSHNERIGSYGEIPHHDHCCGDVDLSASWMMLYLSVNWSSNERIRSPPILL